MAKTYKEFMDNMQVQYAGFERNAEVVRREGLKAGIKPEGLGGYFVILRHPDSVTEPVAEFASKVKRAVPSAVAYDKTKLHTTISDYDLKPLAEFSPEKGVLDVFSSAVRKIKIWINSPPINFGNLVYNQTTAIAPGIPAGRGFFDVSQSFVEEVGRRGIELRSPWGAHMTSVRFAEAVSADRLEDFFSLMRDAPAVGRSVPEYIDVGSYRLSKETFEFDLYERFKISV